LEYAASIFGHPFDGDAIVTETRISAGDFLGNNISPHVDIVGPEKTDDLDPGRYNNYEDYIKAQYQLWFDDTIQGEFQDTQWQVDLGNKLKEHRFFQNLLKVLNGKICGFDEILTRLEKVTKGLKYSENAYKKQILNSLMALVSEAKVKAISIDDEGKEKIKIRPFLNVRVQLWLREMRRMVSSVGQDPVLRFADDLNQDQFNTHLPLVHCRECGSMGWTGLKRMTDSEIRSDLKDFYFGFFNHDPQVVYLFPEDTPSSVPAKTDQPASTKRSPKTGLYHFCAKCLHVTTQANPQSCPSCDNEN